ncbi:Ff.00g021450.m01.CDS01 [Fusarium sp. VM40]|nr:Ff.00g021450.m01.CDS01 [Fusarium sp. VM40]
MSGFEIVGVVLGSIPIVVSALEYYVKGLGILQNFRSCKRILRSLILALKTEHINLQNICEKLLVGIAPQTCIEMMIREPFGKLWSEEGINNKLRLRLWTSISIFDERVQDMKLAIEEMMGRLNIGPDFESSWIEGMTLKSQLKRIMFIIQKSNYDEALTRIRDGVSALQTLAALNTELEPARKCRSLGRLNKLVSEMLTGIYQALRSTMTCKCTNLHDIGLKLRPPAITITPTDDDQEIIKKLQFWLAVSYMKLSNRASIRQWNEIVLKPNQCMKNVGVEVPSLSIQRSRQSTPTTTATQSSGLNLNLSTVTNTRSLEITQSIDNLCQTMQSIGKKKGGERCGYIKDFRMQGDLKYDLYAHDCLGSSDDWSLVSLKQLTQSHTLLYVDKLRLAWTIACSAFQMQGTPWISNILRAEDIFIAQREGVLQFNHVFTLRQLPENSRSSPLKPSPTNPFMLYLGILLIEIILGHSIIKLESTSKATVEPTVPQYVLDLDVANKFLGRVRMAGGSGYHDAVERCLKSSMHQTEWNRGQAWFQGDIAAAVVNPLETDLRMLGFD